MEQPAAADIAIQVSWFRHPVWVEVNRNITFIGLFMEVFRNMHRSTRIILSVVGTCLALAQAIGLARPPGLHTFPLRLSFRDQPWDRHFSSSLIQGHINQVGGIGMYSDSRYWVFSFYIHLGFHGGRANVTDLRGQCNQIAETDRLAKRRVG